jgi:hypothetical protein
MLLIGEFLYKPLARAAERPGEVQERTLMSILSRNRDTQAGRLHAFAGMKDYADFRARVPVHDNDTVRPLLAGRGKSVLAYLQYRSCPEAFRGKLLRLDDRHADWDTEIAAPVLDRIERVLPDQVFAIRDPEIRFRVMARLAAGHEDITCLSGTDPAGFARLLSVINQTFPEITADIADGRCRYLESLDTMDLDQADAIGQRLKPDPRRASQLSALGARAGGIRYSDLWPRLKLVVTRTREQPFRGLLSKLPAGAGSIELGGPSGAVPGAIAGLPALRDFFFEFAERDAGREGSGWLRRIGELEADRDYRMFVTSSAGLYRHAVGGIIRVAGWFRNTPTLACVGGD